MLIRQSDFTNLIYQDHLNQVTDSKPWVLDESMREAQAEIELYLRAKFNLSKLFVTFDDYKSINLYDQGATVWHTITIHNEITDQDDEVEALFVAKTAVSAGVEPGSDPEKWEMKDPRKALLVQIFKDVTLYHIHSGISPHNIPDLRVKRYNDAIKTLTQIRDGELFTDWPLIELPPDGNTPNYGREMVSQPRQDWYF